MNFYPPLPQESIYQRTPKVDLHRHLEGSLRMETLLDIARLHGMTLPLLPGLRALVKIQPTDSLTFTNFLSKFQTLRLFYRSPQVISRVTREAVEDAAQDHVRYLDLRFTPVALGRLENFPYSDIMDWVLAAAEQAAQDFGICVRLVVSVNRHEEVPLAEKIVHLAMDRKDRGIAAIDLAGNEADFPADPFQGIFNEARQGGLKICVHAGEWNGPQNVRQAIEDFHADRIGHGVRIMEDENVVALARERATTFEVCVTSNYQSGVTQALTSHPLMRMLMAGLNVTINTDDPSISQITLGHEYRVVCEELGLPLPQLSERILAAARSTFLEPARQQELIHSIQPALANLAAADPG